MTVIREKWTDTADLITIIEDGKTVVGEMGVCTDHECRCEGVWSVWGETVSPIDIPHVAGRWAVVEECDEFANGGSGVCVVGDKHFATHENAQAFMQHVIEFRAGR